MTNGFPNYEGTNPQKFLSVWRHWKEFGHLEPRGWPTKTRNAVLAFLGSYHYRMSFFSYCTSYVKRQILIEGSFYIYHALPSGNLYNIFTRQFTGIYFSWRGRSNNLTQRYFLFRTVDVSRHLIFKKLRRIYSIRSAARKDNDPLYRWKRYCPKPDKIGKEQKTYCTWAEKSGWARAWTWTNPDLLGWFQFCMS